MAKGIGRNGELFERLCQPEHLIQSARAAARGKRLKPEVAEFLLELEPECFRLADELASGVWRPGPYHSFWIREPKRRLISAASFRDRVVHHAIVSLLEPHFERRFSPHSYACRRGKGTHRALLRASDWCRRRPFVLKCDLVKFFPSLDHEVVKAELRRVIEDEQLVRVVELVIDGSSPQEPVTAWFAGDDLFAPGERRRGLPIGNLTSQFLANVVLDVLDHFVTERLRLGDYVRYCDDFLVFGDSPAELRQARRAIDGELALLRLRAHERKGGVHATSSPIPFLGFVLKGAARRLQRESALRATRRLRRLRAGAGVVESDRLGAGIAAWVAHARYATSPRAASATLHRAGFACRR